MPKKEPTQKKRGRKPKGGKLVDAKDLPKKMNTMIKPNIILHLQCFLSDLKKEIVSENTVDAYNEHSQSIHFSAIHQVDETNYQSHNTLDDVGPTPDETKQLVDRLHDLD